MNYFIKKLFTCILILSLVLSGFAVNASTDEAISSPYEKAVNLLMSLGILDGYSFDDFNPDDNVTRAEIATVLVRLSGIASTQSDSDSDLVFSDIQGNPALGDILAAHSLGYINGYDGKFLPDDNVTYEQVLKMLVNLLGYEVYAKGKGDYPIGYTTVANEKGITRNVKQNLNEVATKGNIALFIYNSLNVDIMQQVGYGNNLEYNIKKGNTILTKKLKVQKGRGIITANSETKLISSSGVSENQIQIDDVTYENKYSNGKNLLGYYVNYYYKVNDENGDNTIIYIEPIDTKNNATIIKASNISENSDKDKIIYWDDENNSSEKEAIISNYVDIIYNGKMLSPSSEIYGTNSYLHPVSGYIKIVDNDNDGKIDVLFVYKYDNIFVDKNMDNVITDKYASDRLDLDEKSTSFRVIATKNGNEIDVSSIENRNLISVAKSEDGNLVNIIVSVDSIDGEITEVSEGKITIEDKEYDVANSYLNAPNKFIAKAFAIGDTGTFYLDADGKVAAANLNYDNSLLYGYLINCAQKSGVSDQARFKIFTSSGAFVYLDSAKKMKLNGESSFGGVRFNGSNIIKSTALIQSIDGQLVCKDQLIKYVVNEQGEITEIYTAEDRSDANKIGIIAENADKFYLDAYVTGKDLSFTYKSDSGSFMSSLTIPITNYISTATVIFNIPTKLEDEELYSVEPLTTLFSDMKCYNTSIYDLNNSRVARAVVLRDIYNYEAIISALRYKVIDNKVGIISKISDIINSQGEPAKQITAYYQKKEMKYIISKRLISSCVASSLKVGDIIQFQLDNKLEILAFARLFTFEAPSDDLWIMSSKNPLGSFAYDLRDLQNTYRYAKTGLVSYYNAMSIYGKVYSYNDVEHLSIITGFNEQGKPMVYANKLNIYANIYLIDATNPSKIKVSLAKKEDIIPANLPSDLPTSWSDLNGTGSTLFVFRTVGTIRDAVIIKQ